MSLYPCMCGGSHNYFLRISLHLHQPGVGSEVSKGICIDVGGKSESVVVGKKSEDG